MAQIEIWRKGYLSGQSLSASRKDDLRPTEKKSEIHADER